MKKIFFVFSCIFLSIFCFVSLSACDNNAIMGKSAYEIAVENGFEGTVSEWLESLKGDPGADGFNGQDGKDGINGNNGKPGKDGESFDFLDVWNLALEYNLYDDNQEDFERFLTSFFPNVNNQKANAQYISSKALMSVVGIYCENAEGYFQAGAGVFYLIDSDASLAYVITNYHVVCCEDNQGTYISDNICLYLYGQEIISRDKENNIIYGDAISATFIGGSPNYDLAVLKVEEEDFHIISSYAKEVTFANSDEVQPGEIAVSIGNPLGTGLSVSSGVVSKDSEWINILLAGKYRELRCLKIDTSTNPGNSGGGLFDKDANLLGIVCAKKSNYIENGVLNVYEGLGYAIEGNIVKNIAKNIIDFYQNSEGDEPVGVTLVKLGIKLDEIKSKNIYDNIANTNIIVSQVQISYLEEDCFAESLGFEIGDILKTLKITDVFDEERTYELTRDFMIKDALLTLRKDYLVLFEVERDGEIEEISFVVTEENFVIS